VVHGSQRKALRVFRPSERRRLRAAQVGGHLLVANRRLPRPLRAALQGSEPAPAARQEARSAAIFRSAVDGILAIDGAQRVVEANEAAAAMFGIPSADLRGLALRRLIPERLRDSHRGHFAAFASGNEEARKMAYSRDLVGLHADGHEFPVEVTISRVPGTDSLCTAIVRDLTERRQSERAVQVGKAKLQAALAAMSDAVFIADRLGNLAEANHAFASFHRFASRAECPVTFAEWTRLLELRGRDGEPIAHDDWPVPRALRGERGVGVEYGVRRTDTGEAWVASYSFAPVRDRDGGLLGAVVVGRDVTAWHRLQTELETSQSDLRRLLAREEGVQEAERTRIAQDLHDDLQQTLTGIAIDLVTAKTRLAAGRRDLLPTLESAQRLTSEAVQALRRVIDDLRPPMLDQLGLVPALRHLVEQLGQRHGLTCRFVARVGDDRAEACDGRRALCLYRVAQEAMNNVVKHAGARTVQVALDSRQGGHLRLSIQDDGHGYRVDGPRQSQSFGLFAMHERVRAAGGRLDIRSGPTGTTVEVELPSHSSAQPASLS